MDHKLNSVSTETISTLQSESSTSIKTVIKQSESNLQNPSNARIDSNENQNLDRSDLLETPPKVTVSLPKHAASRLRALAQKRDIALVKLGILSIQFENDQIIPLTMDTANLESINRTETMVKNQARVEKQIHFVDKACTDDHNQEQGNDIKFSVVRDQLPSVDESIQDLNASITTYTSFNSPSGGLIIPNDDLNLDGPNLSGTGSPMMDSSLSVATTLASAMPTPKNIRNNSKLTVPFDDDDDDVKEDEETIANDVELFSRGSAQLTQLEFADPIELEMYESDNLLFPDYTLNLS